MKKYLGEKAFSIIEIILVIGILSLIVTGASVVFFSTLTSNQETVAVEELISTLREIQLRAMDGEDSSSFGIIFFDDSYIEFKGSKFDEDSQSNVPHFLSVGTKIEDINFGGKNYVVFNRLTGNVESKGSLVISVTGGIAKKKIIINSLGVINLEDIN